MRDSFVFYRSFWDAIKNLPEADQLSCIRAILEYGFDEKEPEDSGVAKAIFMMARPQIDANNRRYQNGTKGGRPKTGNKPKHNQSITKVEPNVNDNVNENVNENDKDNMSSPTSGDRPAYPYEDIIAYLNQKAGTHYRHTSEDSRKHIRARFEEGYTVEDFRTVIDKKVQEWKGTERERYLRPATLFGTKFESYLNQRIVSGSGARPTGFSNFQQRNYDMDELERQLLGAQEGRKEGG